MIAAHLNLVAVIYTQFCIMGLSKDVDHIAFVAFILLFFHFYSKLFWFIRNFELAAGPVCCKPVLRLFRNKYFATSVCYESASLCKTCDGEGVYSSDYSDDENDVTYLEGK